MQVINSRHTLDHALIRPKILPIKSIPKTVGYIVSERSLKLPRNPILDCHSGIGLLQNECALSAFRQATGTSRIFHYNQTKLNENGLLSRHKNSLVRVQLTIAHVPVLLRICTQSSMSNVLLFSVPSQFVKFN